MRLVPRTLALVGAVALAALAAGCDDDNIAGPDRDRMYSQIERLGNPLTSEVFFMKRDHGLHNTTGPSTDVANDFRGKIVDFIASFGRSATIQNTVSTVLVPDMLRVFPNRQANSAGWLSWALANGWGGRTLSDDVVDAGLSAVFGTLVDPAAGTVAGLTSDNVPASTRTFAGTFPYLEPPR
jgi:hypothetical protein